MLILNQQFSIEKAYKAKSELRRAWASAASVFEYIIWQHSGFERSLNIVRV